jgi:putative transcriptional regulator
MTNTTDNALNVAYEMATDLHESGIMDDLTMEKVKLMRFPAKKEFSSAEIKKIRALARMSQSVFALLLNVGKSTVVKWENGDRHPTGSAMRVLQLLSDTETGNPAVRLISMLERQAASSLPEFDRASGAGLAHAGD